MRLIDAEALRDVFDKYVRHISLMKKGKIPKKDLAILADCVGMIDDQPTADAVSVVRCKDCKYNLNGLCDQISLEWHPFRVEDDEFCAWAERKEHETN